MNTDKTATVMDLIDFLENNFKKEDKMCYWHEGGAWIDCEPIYKSLLGRYFLRYVSEEKEERRKSMSVEDYSEEKFAHDYRMVGDKDVLIY